MNRKTIYILIFLAFFLWLPLFSQIRILSIGDSTMAEYDVEKRSGENEMRGWAQMLPAFLTENVTLTNAAKNGRSSKSFYNEFWTTGLRETLKPGDYVFIQFGHNDEKAEGKDTEGNGLEQRGTAAWGQYQEYLKRYINESRERGAKPILFTPIVRCLIDSVTNTISDIGMHNLIHLASNATVMNYPEAMRSLAMEMNVPLIDMTLLTKKLVESYGADTARKIIFARNDNTHLRALGGLLISELAVKEMLRQNILSEYLNIPEVLSANEIKIKTTKKENTVIPYDKGQKLQILWSPSHKNIKTKEYKIEISTKGLQFIEKDNKRLLTIIGNKWQSGEIDMDPSRYIEFKLTAVNDLYMENLRLGMESTGRTMFFTALASTDKTFQKVYTIATMEKLQQENVVLYKYNSVIKVDKGKSLYLRIYPWSQSSSMEQYIHINEINISGVLIK